MNLKVRIDHSSYLVWFHSIHIWNFICYFNFETQLNWIILPNVLNHLYRSISSWLFSLFLIKFESFLLFLLFFSFLFLFPLFLLPLFKVSKHFFVSFYLLCLSSIIFTVVLDSCDLETRLLWSFSSTKNLLFWFLWFYSSYWYIFGLLLFRFLFLLFLLCLLRSCLFGRLLRERQGLFNWWLLLLYLLLSWCLWFRIFLCFVLLIKFLLKIVEFVHHWIRNWTFGSSEPLRWSVGDLFRGWCLGRLGIIFRRHLIIFRI